MECNLTQLLHVKFDRPLYLKLTIKNDFFFFFWVLKNSLFHQVVLHTSLLFCFLRCASVSVVSICTKLWARLTKIRGSISDGEGNETSKDVETSS